MDKKDEIQKETLEEFFRNYGYFSKFLLDQVNYGIKKV